MDITPAGAALAIAAAVGSFIVIHCALALFRRRLCRIEEQQHADRPVAELLKATLAQTSNLAVIATALLIGLSMLDLPPPWDERVRHLWFIALGAQFAIYVDHAITVVAHRYFASHGVQPGEPISVARTLTMWGIKIAVWVVFLLAMLSNLGINVTAFVASLGIGGVAVALAVQNILGDLFASLSIAVDKPFEVGDAISVAGMSGNVEHVGLKTTRIRADSGEQIVIGNADLLKQTVRNFKRMQERRVQFALKLPPDTATDRAAQVPQSLRKIIEGQQGVRFGRAHVKCLDQNFLEVEVVYFVLDASYSVYMDCQQAIILAAMKSLDEIGIDRAAPAPV